MKEYYHRSGMKSKILWGIFLILLGILLLLHNYGFSIGIDLGRDWPIIIIAIGILRLLEIRPRKKDKWIKYAGVDRRSKEDIFNDVRDGKITIEQAMREMEE